MSERLETRKYTFTVEGETEQWYFLWLRDQINRCPNRIFNVAIDVHIQQSPRKYYKNINMKTTPRITHICDVESSEAIHVEKFHAILTGMKEARDQKGIDYSLGYSNYAFELWMVLHKRDCNGSLGHRRQYLGPIIQAFGERFEDLDHYKNETAFKRCLSKLTLDDVKSAIRRAEMIMAANKADQRKILHYKGYSYYENNPSLTIHEVVRMMLVECGLIK